jgi:uncharacterized repeat protein (TIGR01451 family)
MKKLSIFLNILIVVSLFSGLVPKAEASYGYISVSQSYIDGNSGPGPFTVYVSWNSGGFDQVSGAVVYVSLNNSEETLFSYQNFCNNCVANWIYPDETTQVYEFRLYEYNSFTGWVGNLLSKATVTVSPRVGQQESSCQGYKTLVITPSNATVNVGQTQNFRALYDPDGPSCPQAEQDKTSEASWNTSNPNIASLTGPGAFTGRSSGSVTITANFQGITAWANLEVFQPQPNYNPQLSINKTNFITTDTWQLTLRGAPPNQQVYICAIDNRGGQSCTPVQNLGLRQTTDSNGNWSASGSWNGDESVIGNWTEWVYVGGILQSGQVTGGVRSNNINFTISRPPQTCQGNKTLVIIPPSATININQTQNFKALYDPDGPSCPQAEQDKTSEASWNTSNPNVASQTGSGSFTGRSAGSATITARFDGITAQAVLNVNQGPNNSAPQATTLQATSITQNSAVLNGSVNPNNSQTQYRFEYGTTPSLGNQTSWQSVGSGNTAVNVFQSISGLQSNTTYYFRIVAQNQYGTTQGQILSFVTQNNIGGAPVATTQPATNITTNSATLNAIIDPNNNLTYYRFEYGTSPSNLTNFTASSTVSGSISNTPVSMNISGLQSNTVYYFRIYAANNFGESRGQILSFTTSGGGGGSIPQATTLQATSITQNSAVLNGSVNPNNSQTQYRFEYGTTPSLGNQTSWQSVGSGNTAVNVFQSISGLQSNTTYYFRIVAQNQYGTTQGQILSFVTDIVNEGRAPDAFTDPATGISYNSAVLNGRVNPNGNNTSYYFEYGTNSSFGYTTGFQSAGSGNSQIFVSSYISGLNPNTTYYFRIVAQNNYGRSYGSTYTFTTNFYGGGFNPPGFAPYVTTYSATNVSLNSATLNAQVNPNNSDTQAWFEYGTSPNYLPYTTGYSNIGSGNYNYNFNQNIYNLSANTTYYFRAVARNQYGINYGQILSFSTGSGSGYYYQTGNQPIVRTLPATYVSTNSALLNGEVNPNGGLTSAWIEYGPNVSLGLRTTVLPMGSANQNLPYSFAVTGLLPNTIYYFRMVAQNQYGTSYGQILSFQTQPTGVTYTYTSPPPTQIITYTPRTQTTTPEYGRQIDCITIVPTINGTKLDPGSEFTYITTIRNNCNFKLENAVLRVVLPQETNFVSTPFPAYSVDGNTVIFNLGNVDIGAQTALNTLGKIKTNTRNGDHLVFSSILTFNYKNSPNTLTTYLTAVVGQEVSGGGFAAVIKTLGGIFTSFIFWLIVILAMGFWIIYLLITRKRESEEKYDLSGLKIKKEI